MLVIQNYSTGDKDIDTNMKKWVQWDLHVYVVCECRKYLGIVAAEYGISISKFTDKALISL